MTKNESSEAEFLEGKGRIKARREAGWRDSMSWPWSWSDGVMRNYRDRAYLLS